MTWPPVTLKYFGFMSFQGHVGFAYVLNFIELQVPCGSSIIVNCCFLSHAKVPFLSCAVQVRSDYNINFRNPKENCRSR